MLSEEAIKEIKEGIMEFENSDVSDPMEIRIGNIIKWLFEKNVAQAKCIEELEAKDKLRSEFTISQENHISKLTDYAKDKEAENKQLKTQAEQFKEIEEYCVVSFECLPKCDSHGHEELCPYADPFGALKHFEAENKRLRGALEKYADKENWGYHDEGGCPKGHGQTEEACFIGLDPAVEALKGGNSNEQ